MPAAGELPEELTALCRRNAVELSNTRWDFDVQRLVEAVEAAGVQPARHSAWRRLAQPVLGGEVSTVQPARPSTRRGIVLPVLGGAALLAALGLGYVALRPSPEVEPISAATPAPSAEELRHYLETHDWSVRAAARHYRRDRKQIYRWIHRYELERDL